MKINVASIIERIKIKIPSDHVFGNLFGFSEIDKVVFLSIFLSIFISDQEGHSFLVQAEFISTTFEISTVFQSFTSLLDSPLYENVSTLSIPDFIFSSDLFLIAITIIS
jgi:hypothetical protein